MTIEDNTLLLFKPWLLGYCNCGCGDKTKYHGNRLNRYIYTHNSRGEGNPFWNGGKHYEEDGYELILDHNHPYRNSINQVRKHRLVMEKHLGRYLDPKEVVHHIDKNPQNNDITNLMLFPSHSEHMKFERKKDFSYRICSECESDITYFSISKQQYIWATDGIGGYICRNCNRKKLRRLGKNS